MDVRTILAIIIATILLVSFFFIIFGLLQKPKYAPIHITSGNGTFNKQCRTQKVSCNTDADCLATCSEASEGTEMVCRAIPNVQALTDTQKKLLGSNTNTPSKYCVPAGATMSCNVAMGGIPVFSGWSGDVSHMEFDCFCSYPQWASARICDPSGTGYCGSPSCELNPGICEGGILHWDLTKKAEEPLANMCECASGDVLVVDNNGLPRCVPKDIQNFYSDLDTDTYKSAGQPLVALDNVPGTSYASFVCPATGPLAAQYTECNAASPSCCPLPNATCCGDFCCPSNFPVCDTTNKRCMRANNTCTTNETKCTAGCCPFLGGVCNPDGETCCPPNFPIADTERGMCNPIATALVKCDPTQNGYKTCNNGCCPGGSDWICAGDGLHCCPPSYPLYIPETNSCRAYTN